MIRRYSPPRTFSAGWIRPFLPRLTKSRGLTTMPSPPDAVRASHQPIGQRHVPDVVVVEPDATFAGEQVERGDLQVVDAGDGPDIGCPRRRISPGPHGAVLVAGLDGADIDIAAHGAGERLAGGPEPFSRGGGDRRILTFDQAAGLG